MSNGDKVNCIDIKGAHVFEAGLSAGNNAAIYSLHLLSIVIYKNGNPVGVDYINNLPISDVLLLMECINVQSEKLPKQ